MHIQRPRLTRRDDSLIGQVVAANVVLVALTILAASLAAGLDISVSEQRWQFLVLALAIVLTLCVNLWMLQRRFAPLERLIERVEGVDPSHPASLRLDGDNFDEIERLAQSFRRLLDRIESERRRGGRLVVRAQEEERRRLARDLHDEVNQALTAILLRLEALAQDEPPERTREVGELKLLVNQAMEELTGLARQLRPSALDDHGLVPAIEAQLRRFSSRAGVESSIATHGDPSVLGEDEQIAIYRVAQEALTNAGRHSGASHVEVEVTLKDACVELRVSDDGQGFEPSAESSEGLGLKGMAERARLVGGELDVRSAPGNGTTVTLRIQ
jgi:two-component system, NarL family, sensor histidine kinase UhpB